MSGDQAVTVPAQAPPGRDLARAVVPAAAVASVVYAAVTDPAPGLRVALLAVAAASFGLWARRPDRTLAFVLGVPVAVVLAKGTGGLDVGLFLLSLLAVVVAGWERSRAVIGLAAVVVPGSVVLVTLLRPGDIDVGVWLLGVAVPGLMAWLVRRQEELGAELEQARRDLLRREVDEEHRRIARDVHDLVGHGLAAVLLHVTGARHVLRRDPDEAESALRDAEETGRRNLAELRSTVALLRTGTDDDPVSAVPGLPQLDELVQRTRDESGIDVRHDVRGPVDDVDPLVALTVYRIAQEALHNAVRHAPHARTRLSVDADGQRVALRVDSRPVAVVPGRHGYGLVGMRERAAAVGAELRAGPDGDGWLVECVLPGPAS